MYSRNPLQEKRTPPSCAWLMATMPKVGDKRMERPTIIETTRSNGSIQLNDPQPCVVVLVHPGHLWYMVQFENGMRECYKVPKYIPVKERYDYD